MKMVVVVVVICVSIFTSSHIPYRPPYLLHIKRMNKIIREGGIERVRCVLYHTLFFLSSLKDDKPIGIDTSCYLSEYKLVNYSFQLFQLTSTPYYKRKKVYI